jgi:hypothetical protein
MNGDGMTRSPGPTTRVRLRADADTPETLEAQAATDFLLSEFAALRQEIAQRSTAQHTLLNLNITAIATVIGFILSGNGRELLLLVVPLPCFALGTLYFDHGRCIDRIGLYIDEHLTPVAREVSNNSAVLEWESRVREDQNSWLGRLVWAGPIFLAFVGAGVVAVVAAAFPVFVDRSGPAASEWWPAILWGAEVILMAILITIWVKVSRPFLAGAPRGN